MWQIALDNYYFPGLQSSFQSAVGKFNICQLCQKLLFLIQKFFLSEADLQVKSSFRESGHAFPFIKQGVKSFAGSVKFLVAAEYHSLHVILVCFVWYKRLKACELLCS